MSSCARLLEGALNRDEFGVVLSVDGADLSEKLLEPGDFFAGEFVMGLYDVVDEFCQQARDLVIGWRVGGVGGGIQSLESHHGWAG